MVGLSWWSKNTSGVQAGFLNLKGDLLESVPPVIADLLLMI
jgi:hypothetical protein